MEFAKFTGKTLDEALAAACNAKGCTKEELHYEVTEEKSGFLGIGKTIEIEAYCPKDIDDFIKSYIQTYFDNAELDGTVEIENDHGFYRITVNTKNNAIMIGKAGKPSPPPNRPVFFFVSVVFILACFFNYTVVSSFRVICRNVNIV